MATRGELEQRILVLLWEADGPLTVAAVHQLLQQERDLAYTTVMTVLDRLAKKGLVGRTMVQRAWEYSPAQSEEDLVARDMLALLAECSPDARTGALSRFFASLTPAQRELLQFGDAANDGER